ncbi:hypothetical protein ACP3TI_12715, partial [Desulforudis sp. 1190]|uniref:hypothetical protein n=1 Tax=Desulforudis sp. 1190 TaxID=3416136 RepID=UPI003CEE8271
MIGFIKNWFDDNAREVKRLSRDVAEINALEPEMQALSDEELAAKTVEFRERLANGAEPDHILAPAFAEIG